MDITILLASELLWAGPRAGFLNLGSTGIWGRIALWWGAVLCIVDIRQSWPKNHWNQKHHQTSMQVCQLKKKNHFQTSLSQRTTPTWLHLYSVAFPSHSCHGADPSISLGPQASRVLKSCLTILTHLCGQPHKTTGFFSWLLGPLIRKMLKHFLGCSFSGS